MAKKIYILMGNPDKVETLSNDLADAYAEAATAAGHEVRRDNIHDLQFDPILHQGYKVIQTLEPDLLKVQDNMRWADHLVLIYPLWWSTMPALLKALFDRMWLPAFAFHFWKNGWGWDRLMKGKTARVIILSKMNPFLIQFMFGDFTHEIRSAILGFAGYRVRITKLGDSESLTTPQRTRWMNRIRKLAQSAR